MQRDWPLTLPGRMNAPSADPETGTSFQQCSLFETKAAIALDQFLQGVDEANRERCQYWKNVIAQDSDVHRARQKKIHLKSKSRGFLARLAIRIGKEIGAPISDELKKLSKEK
jgi:hypothetical protein